MFIFAKRQQKCPSFQFFGTFTNILQYKNIPGGSQLVTYHKVFLNVFLKHVWIGFQILAEARDDFVDL